MNKKDHFDELFTSRLRDQDSEIESWNTPSERVWENAKVHFPKPKKKRRFFIIIFPLLGFLSALLLIYTNNTKSKIESHTVNVTNEIFESDPVEDDLKKNSPNPSESSVSDRLEPQVQNEIDESVPQTEITSLSGEKTSNANTSIVEYKNFSSFDKNRKENVQSWSSGKIKPTTKQLELNSQHSGSFTISNNLLETEIINVVESTSSVLNYNIRSSEKIPATVELKNKQSINISELATLPISHFKTDITNPEAPAPQLIKVKKRMSPYRWAVGAHTARFLVNPFLDFDEPNENTINTKYSMINLTLALQTGKRSSITTGISFLNSRINIGSEFIETYDSNQPSESIASNIAESSQIGALSINDNESAIMITILPDLQLSNGDLLNIKSEIPLEINGFSIPIIYKRQFPMNRLTPYLMGGLSIDFFEIKIDEIFLDIRHMNQIIHEPVSFEPLKEVETIGSLFLGLGSQYNFNERWFGEVSVVTDLFDVTFTRIEVGINYRF